MIPEKDWNLYDERNRFPPATIDPAWFGNALRRVEEDRRNLEGYVVGLGLPTLSLYYQDFLVDWRATFERACSFLGVRFEPVQRRSIKNTGAGLRQAVSNFEELRSYVETSYEPMFDEVLISARNLQESRLRPLDNRDLDPADGRRATRAAQSQ